MAKSLARQVEGDDPICKVCRKDIGQQCVNYRNGEGPLCTTCAAQESGVTVGKIVNATLVDQVRIEAIGRAITVPAEFVLAMHDVFRAAVSEEEGLDVYDVEEWDTKEIGWEAVLGNFVGSGQSPFEAVSALAEKLQWDGRAVRGNPK